MRMRSSLKLQHKCLDCSLRSEGFFCSLDPHILEEFESLKITNAYPKGATLFFEGQLCEGVYMLCQGRVKLSIYSRDGKAIIIRIAEPGEVLGLSAVASGHLHEATAQVVEPCQVNFVRKKNFLRFLRKNGDAGLNAVLQLSTNYHKANTQIRSLGLSNSAADKLARLFLTWCQDSSGSNGDHQAIKVRIGYTHAEIAEMIGSSRETVTRLIKGFKDREMISEEAPNHFVFDKKKIAAAVGLRHF